MAKMLKKDTKRPLAFWQLNITENVKFWDSILKLFFPNNFGQKEHIFFEEQSSDCFIHTFLEVIPKSFQGRVYWQPLQGAPNPQISMGHMTNITTKKSSQSSKIPKLGFIYLPPKHMKLLECYTF